MVWTLGRDEDSDPFSFELLDPDPYSKYGFRSYADVKIAHSFLKRKKNIRKQLQN
jgi:hypothetical protein